MPFRGRVDGGSAAALHCPLWARFATTNENDASAACKIDAPKPRCSLTRPFGTECEVLVPHGRPLGSTVPTTIVTPCCVFGQCVTPSSAAWHGVHANLSASTGIVIETAGQKKVHYTRGI